MAVKAKAHVGAATAARAAKAQGLRAPEASAWARAGEAATTALLDVAEGPAIQRLLTDMQGTVGNQAVQRMMAGRRQAATAQRLQARAGRGRPLEPSVQRKVGQALGTDLSTVQVHDDDEADQLARGLGAEAFTSGHDIYFTKGAYDPASEKGLKTVAHEATHVVQQSHGPVDGVPIGGGMTVSDPSDRFEREAEATAEKVSGGGGGGGKALEPKAGGHGAPGGTAGKAVQRACGCGGSCGPCSGDKDEEKPLQRLPAPGAPTNLAVQRKKHGADPLGASIVEWDPKASFDFTRPDGTKGNRSADIGEDDQATFSDIPRDAAGLLTMPVTATWRPPGPGPGPVPPKPESKCDVCSILKDAATRSLGSFVRRALNNALPGLGFAIGLIIQPAIEGIGALLGASIPILPSDLVKKCNEVDIDDAIRQLQDLKDKFDSGICDVILDPGTGKDVCEVIDVIAKVLIAFPPLTPFALGFQRIKSGILEVFSDSIGDVLKELKKLRKECKKGGTGPTPGTASAGQAVTTLRLRVFTTPEGEMKVVGPSPAPIVNGTGATLSLPVDSTKDSTATGAFVTQSPLLKTTDGKGMASRVFMVTIDMVAAPGPRDVNCFKLYFPFKTDSDKFENEGEALGEMLAFFNGLHPVVRRRVEDGTIPLKVIGRASRSGSFDHNFKLSEKRAKRVAGIFRGFSGGGNMTVTHVGELEATGASNNAGEDRNAESQVTGQLTGKDAAALEGADTCFTNVGGGAGPAGEELKPGEQTEPPAPVDAGGEVFEPIGAEEELVGGGAPVGQGDAFEDFFEPAFA